MSEDELDAILREVRRQFDGTTPEEDEGRAEGRKQRSQRPSQRNARNPSELPLPSKAVHDWQDEVDDEKPPQLKDSLASPAPSQRRERQPPQEPPHRASVRPSDDEGQERPHDGSDAHLPREKRGRLSKRPPSRLSREPPQRLSGGRSDQSSAIKIESRHLPSQRRQERQDKGRERRGPSKRPFEKSSEQPERQSSEAKLGSAKDESEAAGRSDERKYPSSLERHCRSHHIIVFSDHSL
jgi:hypothetical protein